MNALLTKTLPKLVLDAETAEDLMTANPISINASTSVQEALAMLTDRGLAPPVIDEAGQDRRRPEPHRPARPRARAQQRSASRWRSRPSWDFPPRHHVEGFSVEVVDPTRMRNIMTPVVFTVSLDTAVPQVIEQMLSLKVHHLFVVDEESHWWVSSARWTS